MTVLDGELDCDSETFLYHRTTCQKASPKVGSVKRMHTQSPVAFAMSSPTFLGDRPNGPIFGASADDAPTSPPVARRCMTLISLGSTLGGMADGSRVLGKEKVGGGIVRSVRNRWWDFVP